MLTRGTGPDMGASRRLVHCPSPASVMLPAVSHNVSYPPGNDFTDPLTANIHQPANYQPSTPNQTPQLLAIVSLVTGAMSVMNCVCCLFLPFPILSIALGGIALTQKPDQSGKVMALIGMTISALVLVAFFGSMLYFALNPTPAQPPLIPFPAPAEPNS